MATDTIPIEKFWQELAEFKAVVDNYARTHRESTDRDRRKYFESLQDYKDKIKILRQSEMEVRQKLEKAKHDIQRYNIDINHVKREISKHEQEVETLPPQVEIVKTNSATQLRELESLNDEYDQTERSYKEDQESLRESITLYESLLSMRYEQSSRTMKWIFKNIDPRDPERECYFIISKETREIIETHPPLCKIDELAHRFKHKTFSVFVIHVRKIFKEVCAKDYEVCDKDYEL